MKSLSQYISETNHWWSPKIQRELEKINGDIKSLNLDEKFTDVAFSIINKDRKFKDGRFDVIKLDTNPNGFSVTTNNKDLLDEALNQDNVRTTGIVMYTKNTKATRLIIINTKAKEIRWDSDDNKLKLTDDIYDLDGLFRLLIDNKVINTETEPTYTAIC